MKQTEKPHDSRDIFVVGTARTAIGTFGGALKDVPNTQLATTAVKAAIERSGVAPDAIGHVVMGNVIPTDVKDAYLSRVAAIDAGCPIETPAFNVNRLCGSGLQAIVSAAQAIALGDCDIAIGGGSESMSRGPYFDTSARYGARMGDAVLVDYMLGILHDPWEKMHMGITAENVAARYEHHARAAGRAGRRRASSAPPRPSRPAASRSRSFRSRSRRARASCCSTPTSTCAPTPRSKRWPKMKPAFKKDGAGDGRQRLGHQRRRRRRGAGRRPSA